MKNFKRILCVCLIACICLCAVGCNKNTDTNSSGLSSTITQTETSSTDSKIESTEENTSTEESKVSKEDKTETTESKTSKEDSKTNSLSNIASSLETTTSTNLINSDITQSPDTPIIEEDAFDTENESIYNETKIYSVPNFIGELIYEINVPGSYMYDAFEHFTIKTQSENNNEYPNGYILAQSIKAGTNVKEKSEITLFISRMEEKRLPYVYGLDKDQAIDELKKCGFEVELLEKFDFDCMPNSVLETKPAGGTLVPIGATITLYINSYCE